MENERERERARYRNCSKVQQNATEEAVDIYFT